MDKNVKLILYFFGLHKNPFLYTMASTPVFSDSPDWSEQVSQETSNKVFHFKTQKIITQQMVCVKNKSHKDLNLRHTKNHKLGQQTLC